MQDIIKAFNEIAGAPDFEGGFGIWRSVYFLDEEHKKVIAVFQDPLIVYIEYDENGEMKISKDLRTGDIIKLYVNPVPSPVKKD
ncbi:hypothetical protein [Acetivibrio clariflavus]|uniref:Uncharacterized protein n=1 Tax=Acetivibrio clariflavus (strain DSM 19732 / NBRC 101661 / EBR45) TaxID=720554 RepID=G8M306_ACECE|nr:hypothetical protein [Acetivibrio clariflavus]AEV69315.1 hypothetical protein Clocl_2762 [Acetivibrio clariflavus DSM 19732]